VYLVSASPDVIVQPLAEHLGVDGAIASCPLVGDDGRYTGEMEFYSYGPFKAEAMRELAEAEDLDLAESSAYSDSYTDLPMLEAVGHPVAVNPDRVLAKVAREREWEVMQFTKPVRLRAAKGVRRRVCSTSMSDVAFCTAQVRATVVVLPRRSVLPRPRCTWHGGPGTPGPGRNASWSVGQRVGQLLARRTVAPSIKGCRDECVPQSMRADRLGDLRTAGDPPDDPAGPIPVKTPTVRRDEDAVTFSDGQIDRPRGTRRQRDGDGLPALAHDGEGPMTPFEAQGLDASPDRFGDPQSVQRQR
jgi:hypothetical protein